uniref:Beta-defensin-like domain-containing protein n=1 Tax=Salvator merianae TaxID=96440 RepID=A0A8D0C4Z5_SALMN
MEISLRSTLTEDCLKVIFCMGQAASPFLLTLCRQGDGLCVYGSCPSPWYSIGTCIGSWRFCCKM